MLYLYLNWVGIGIGNIYAVLLVILLLLKKTGGVCGWVGCEGKGGGVVVWLGEGWWVEGWWVQYGGYGSLLGTMWVAPYR